MIRRVLRSRTGNVSLIFAGALTLLLGVGALAVDVGMIFLQKRRLQGIADVAALAAAADPTAASAGARAAIAANSDAQASLASLTVGTYSADASVAADARFQPAAAGNAVRVALSGDVPTFFARALMLGTSTAITARATAARIDLAAFSIGSRLAAVQGGLPNALLSGLAGTELNLSVADYQALVSGNVDVLRFAEALRTTLHLEGATFAETLSAQASLPQIARALASASSDGRAAIILNAAAARLPETAITPAQLIDLGPLGDGVRADPARPVTVDAYSILRAVLEAGSRDRQLMLDSDLLIPGLAGTRLWLAVGERAAHSPWLAISAARRITVRTSQVRLYSDTRLTAAAPFGLGSVRVPIYIELAPAEAVLTNVSCAGGRGRATASLSVVPSLGRAAIADLDTGALASFTRALDLRPATIVRAPLASVTAFSDLRLGTRTQNVDFNAADIVERRVKTVSTGDIATGLATSLIERANLSASVLGLGLNAGALTSLVGTILGQAAGPLDSLVDQLTSLSGVRVGQADVWIDGVRCGTPMLVG